MQTKILKKVLIKKKKNSQRKTRKNFLMISKEKLKLNRKNKNWMK